MTDQEKEKNWIRKDSLMFVVNIAFVFDLIPF